MKIEKTNMKVLVSATALLVALAFTACNEQGASGTSKTKSAELNCPELPLDSTATGEFDPIASKDARPCGAITLWGSAMPKSFNMWEDYNSFSAELMGMMFEPLVSLHSTEDREVGILADSWSVSEDGKTFTFHVMCSSIMTSLWTKRTLRRFSRWASAALTAPKSSIALR